MPKRWLVALMVVGFLVTTGAVVMVIVPSRTSGEARPATTVDVDGDAPVRTATTTPSLSATTTTTSSPVPTSTPSSTPVSVPAPPAGDAPLSGRIKPGVDYDGVATFYSTDGSGACGYDPSSDPMTAAMNQTDYEASNACGATVLVQAANGASVTVRITNLCPSPCRVGQLDLSAEAFAMLAEPRLGEIPITWKLISPNATGSISIRYKVGSSQYWCGIQVINHRNPLARLEVRAGAGWKQLSRTDYNYFLSEDGSGCGGAIALTDIYGQRLVVDPLPVRADVVQPTSVQFDQR
ncbi:expansin EXLX1 family cellulose-binding protein [Actinophytocola sp.]|uniref:expansin EXLX1 family cellulose-binding protein n=1 Tax=Actinophytocola sp. TaxID=1872138 RepID=UPI002ED609BE